MHDFLYDHKHEVDKHEFLGCCLDCKNALDRVKAHLLAFHEKIGTYTDERLKELPARELYQLFLVLDDVAHLDVGHHLGDLVLTDPEIQGVLPTVRAFYRTFFDLHERHLAAEILAAPDPWEVLEGFPLYGRYQGLVLNQVEAFHASPVRRLAFVGCGPVPLTLILLARFHKIGSVGVDADPEAVTLARECLRRLHMEEHIEIVQGSETALEDQQWDVVLVAALAEPKERIFHNLLVTPPVRSKQALVICRTYTGMRAILHRPVQPGDIEGFNVVRRLHPPGRVNNTLLLLESQ